MLDAFVAANAKQANAKILTGDPHFKRFKNAVLL
jgi:predicted nucleic acid-binding protein